MSQIHDRITAELVKHNITATLELVNDLARAARPERRERGVTDIQKATDTLLSVTGWDAPMYSRATNLVKALAVGSDYATVGTDLETHYGPKLNGQAWHWWRDDWRGKKGQRPDESGIRQTWKAWEKEQPVSQAQPKSWSALAEWADNGQA